MANKDTEKSNYLTLVERKELAKKLDLILAPKRSKEIFSFKYGIIDGITKTNVETGKKFKITGEAVRQILVEIEKRFTN